MATGRADLRGNLLPLCWGSDTNEGSRPLGVNRVFLLLTAEELRDWCLWQVMDTT